MKAFYCAGTHWDREWYEPFQEYRMWLVELIDSLLDLLDSDPDYRCFHLDGQAIAVQDYLDIRPEQKDRLLEHLRNGRILAGPWHVLPDEWLISSESYIRNIMKGMRTCRSLGFEPMDFAYTPDQFGHVAALPMIMTGFGLKTGIVWRGTQDEHFPAHFVWVGPDGSRMVTHRLADYGGYNPFLSNVRCHWIERGWTEEDVEKYVEPYLEAEKSRSATPLILMLDALDHMPPDGRMPGFMKAMQARYPDVEFVWGSLAEYGAELRQHIDSLPEHRGELRLPLRDAARRWQYLIAHTLSSRYPIKKRNSECETLLEKWAEPYGLFQAMAGGKPILRYLDLAWEYLIKNHPHDSICGCSIDQVHRDMHYRFDQCALIADGFVRRAMADLAHADAAPTNQTNIVIHNPLPFARSGPFEVTLHFPCDWPKKYVDGLASGESINQFRLFTKDDAPVPFQLRKIARGIECKPLAPNGRLGHGLFDLYDVLVDMELPSCGFAGLRAEPCDEAVRHFDSLRTGPLSASNGVFSFTLNADGSGTLEHAASQKRYDGLFQYEDCGDSGDGWTRGPLVNDLVFRSPGSRVTTAVEEDGPLRTVFRVDREFDLPREMDRRTWWRSEDRGTLRVVDRIYVEKGASMLRVRTEVRNTIKDHRFRVLFPTRLAADRSFADTPFAIVARDIAIPPETVAWAERVNPEKPFTSFFGVQNGAAGIALISGGGLHEYEVTQTPDRSLALTLFRSTCKTVRTSGEPDGELLGTMTFEYGLHPFGDTFDPVLALNMASQLQTDIRTHGVAELPETISHLSLRKGAVVVTAIKPADDGDGGIIRFWNPGGAALHDEVRFSVPLREARSCNLNEEPGAPITLNPTGSLPVTVPAYGLASVRFRW
ncbi:MAG TPA: glycoside hydrolase family 38 C-terminal domain-containing protein [Candidatus Hydrogenedentes bacterium]|nr:glycoside hydrolase family 38 C-terminal domain-containing protein [Candidatus Hydrogenedentota bacterium]